MSPELRTQVNQLQKKIAAKPQLPELTPEMEKLAIRQFKSIPQNRKHIIKQALQHACSWCEKEFYLPNTGKSHGICARHMVSYYRDNGLGEPPEAQSKSVDLSTLTPEEKKLLVYLYTITKTSQKSKGVWN